MTGEQTVADCTCDSPGRSGVLRNRNKIVMHPYRDCPHSTIDATPKWCVHCDCPYARCAGEIAALRTEVEQRQRVFDAAVKYCAQIRIDSWPELDALHAAVDALITPEVQP